jgi:hypothetical protein
MTGRPAAADGVPLPERSANMTQKTPKEARITIARQILNRIFTIKLKTSRLGPLGFGVVAAQAAPTII